MFNLEQKYHQHFLGQTDHQGSPHTKWVFYMSAFVKREILYIEIFHFFFPLKTLIEHKQCCMSKHYKKKINVYHSWQLQTQLVKQQLIYAAVSLGYFGYIPNTEVAVRFNLTQQNVG